MLKIDLLNENYKYDSIIRKIVGDIISIYKKELDGEFYLPEDIDEGKHNYNFKKLSFVVELILEPSEDVNDFMLNAEFYHEDEVIVIKIIYNPNTKTEQIYNLIGELNEIVSHEIRHSYQKSTESFDLPNDDGDLTGYEYYTQPHELDAQYYGFKRMAKITKKPFEKLVNDWFVKNKDIHQMNDEESRMVIDKILNFKP